MQNESAPQNPELVPESSSNEAIRELLPTHPTPEPSTPAAPTVNPEIIQKRLYWTDWCLAALVLVLTFLVGSFNVLVSEIWMRLATGRLLANGLYEFGVDPFSSLTAGVTWVNQSWLFDWITYTLYDTLGGPALMAIKALVGVAIAWTLLQIRQRQQSLFVPAVTVAAAMLAASSRFYLRPEMFSYLFLAINLYLLMRNELTPAGTAEVPRSHTHLWILPALWLVWVNIDAWFILGPIVTLLYLIGVLISKVSGQPSSTDARLLGAALGVGLIACLLNPHHVFAFTLPTELAHLLAGTPLPAWMTANGQTVSALQGGSGPAFVRIVSPFSADYFNVFGTTVAGFVFYPLLLVSVASFALPFIGKDWPTRINWSRCLVFLFFLLMAALYDQMVTFFVIVAAPCIVLNVQELFSRMPINADLQQQVILRVVTGAALVLLILAAWPGWLHTQRAGDRVERHVSWDMRPNPSLKQAAEELRDLHKSGKAKHVFNVNRDLPSYLAWFCVDEKGQPLVKSLVDHRYALFADHVDDYRRIRQEMFDLSTKTQSEFERDWQKYAAQHNIDHFAVGGFEGTPAVRTLVLRDLWPRSNEWLLRYADGRTVIFAWKPDGQGEETRVGFFNRLAFGEVPSERRPPVKGAVPPVDAPDFWERYAFGLDEKPLAADASSTYEIQRLITVEQSGHARRVGLWLMSATVADLLLPTRINTFLDFGPPSVAVLQMRASRQAVAENPVHFTSQLQLRQACDRISALEEGWMRTALAGYAERFRTLRQEMRLIQTLTALHNMARVKPDNPGVHLELANIYKQQYYLDFAYDHVLKAHDLLQTFQGDPHQILEQRKLVFDDMQILQRAIDKRRADLDLRSNKANAIGKAFIAMKQQYAVTDQKNKEYVDNSMGLAKEALKALQAAETSKLNNLERALLVDWQFELLLKTGEVRQVREITEDPQQAKQIEPLLGPKFHEWRAVAAMAVGDYATADKAMADVFERNSTAEITLPYRLALVRQLAATNITPFAALTAATFRYRDQQFAGAMQKLADWRLIRGLAALEAGDTGKAAEQFDVVIQTVGDSVRYPDLAVAIHYRDLIRQAQKR